MNPAGTQFILDRPAAQPSSPDFHIAGWVAGPIPLRAVRLKDKAATPLALVGRPDVMRAYPEYAHASGFQGIGPAVPQDGSLAMEFLIGDAWVPYTFQLNTSPSNPPAGVAAGPAAQHRTDDPDVSYETPADPQPKVAPDGRAFPPLDMCTRIGSPTHQDFWDIGLDVRRTIIRSLPPEWSFTNKRVLDFGCGPGRVLRHFAPEAGTAEFWGCDIDLPSVMWLNRHLSPPFRVFQNTEQPTLPLDSNSFDLVYGMSVFTHLNATWNPWLMELRRILRPGAYAFLTFLNRLPYEFAYGVPFPKEKVGMLVKHPSQPWDHGGPSVFISPEWLIENWGGIFDIEFIALEGLHGFQSIALLRKPPSHTPPRRVKPVVRALGSYADIHPHARAQIIIPDRADRGFIDGRGLRGDGTAKITGWAAFRGSRLARVRVLVGGTCLSEIDQRFIHHQEAAPELEDAPRGWFDREIDISTLARGEHTLRLECQGDNGDAVSAEAVLLVGPIV